MQNNLNYDFTPGNDGDRSGYVHNDLPQTGSRQDKKSNVWKYVLTSLISVTLTFILTASVAVVIILSLSSTSRLPVTALPLQSQDEQTKEAVSKLQKAYSTISSNYYRELTDAEMLEAMTSGLASGLDSPYTMYFTAEQNEMIEESFRGEYSGIGAIVAMNTDGTVEITDLIEEGPGIEAGLQIGDIFMSVNGEDVTSVPDVAALAAMVKGPEGTEVELEVYRPLESKRITVVAVRRKIENASVRHKMIDETTGYISISEFSTGVSDHFIEAIEDLESQGAESLIFDLRNNGGGLADEVTKMLDYILPEVTIASFEGRMNGIPFQQSWESEASLGVSEDVRMVTIVNEFSASASELFAGCLRDHDRAYLIGMQTFGKGSGTVSFPLGDGSAVNVTNFLYYLPDGESIEGVGVEPDLVVELPEEARVKAIARLTVQEDTQLSAALDYLENPVQD